MPRALDPGTQGTFTYFELPNGKVKARVRFRDYDGTTRLVSRTGSSQPNAQRALKRALTTRRGAGGTDISHRTRIDALADAWLAAPHTWSPGTARTYGYIIERVKASLGGLRIEEATPAAIGRALAKIHEGHPSAAKSARACLSGMFALAIAHGAITVNPVRDIPVKLPVARKKVRALTREQVESFTDWLRTDKASVDLDLPDLIEWMLATGCRLGEALACRDTHNADGEPLLDLRAATWEINATVIRIGADCFTCDHGRKAHPALAACTAAKCRCTEYAKPPTSGLVIQEHPKTAAGHRVLALPQQAVDLIERRAGELRPKPRSVLILDDRKKFRSETIPVEFGAPVALALRDPSNTAADLRDALARHYAATGTDLTWVTSHVFRKTASTWLEGAGFTYREIADHLGHANPSMTMDRYMGRSVALPAAAKALER